MRVPQGLCWVNDGFQIPLARHLLFLEKCLCQYYHNDSVIILFALLKNWKSIFLAFFIVSMSLCFIQLDDTSTFKMGITDSIEFLIFVLFPLAKNSFFLSTSTFSQLKQLIYRWTDLFWDWFANFEESLNSFSWS